MSDVSRHVNRSPDGHWSGRAAAWVSPRYSWWTTAWTVSPSSVCTPPIHTESSKCDGSGSNVDTSVGPEQSTITSSSDGPIIR